MEEILKQISEGMKELKEDVKELREEQKLIKQAVLETNKRVKKLEEIQESQHKIIELLTIRSVEQEAKIRSIK